MAKAKNQQIGTCPCIAKGCDETAAVFKFRQRASDDGARRFGGKWYAHCPKGHTFGTRGDSQDYIAEKGDMWGASKQREPSEKAASAPVAAPVKTAEKPAPAPVQHQSKQPTKRAGFGFFR